MKVAIASSGLGHVARGIETWAADTANTLAEIRDSGLGTRDPGLGAVSAVLQVTLFAGAPVSGLISHPSSLISVLPCLKRNNPTTQQLATLAPGFAWRWDLKSAYGWEQFSFWLRLWPILRRDKFDILHVQDPMLAYWCRKFRKLGLVRTKEILAHGTEEPPEFLAQFECVQHLAPWHLRNAERGTRSRERPAVRGMRKEVSAEREAQSAERMAHGARRVWTAIPNFVDTERFSPADGAAKTDLSRSFPPEADPPLTGRAKADLSRRSFRAKADCRRKSGIPDDAFVVGCVAAVKKHHKRIDYLIREFSNFLIQPSAFSLQPYLLIAGAWTDESDELVRLADAMIPGKAKIMLDLPREAMPDLYRAMDVFVLPSLFEMMPISVIEAMASGLPVVANKHPVLEWMIGAHGATSALWAKWPLAPQGATRQSSEGDAESVAAGACIDMGREGELAGFLAQLTPDWVAARGETARARAVEMFSIEAVAPQILEMYGRVMG